MSDLIDRQQAIDALGGNEPVGDPSKMDDDDVVKMWERIRIINIINKLPSAQPDLSEYSDKLWKSAYERGKRDALEELTDVNKKGDLISRQALLRQIDIDADGEPGYYGDTWKFIDTIKMMPSAQPEHPMQIGWICPVCGRGLSPLTSVCPCNNGKGWEITC